MLALFIIAIVFCTFGIVLALGTAAADDDLAVLGIAQVLFFAFVIVVLSLGIANL